jgi:hypothetical protein
MILKFGVDVTGTSSYLAGSTSSDALPFTCLSPTKNTILSKFFQQTTFRPSRHIRHPSASSPSQTRPRTVHPNTGAERRPKSTRVMSCKHSHTFNNIRVSQRQVQRSHFRSCVTRAAGCMYRCSRFTTHRYMPHYLPFPSGRMHTL